MGPLEGLRVVELAGIGPAPFCAMLLADLGADVIRVERPQPGGLPMELTGDPLSRGRRRLRLDLKNRAGVQALLRLADRADALVEGFRPGVMERLGLGPEVCLARNPRLVYGRMTGFGQDGPLAGAAGHDINYIALAGVLGHIGRRGEPPTVPLNLIADFGGGGLLLAFGLMCALFERGRSGRGQVVDASMVDGAALLMTFLYGAARSGLWSDERGANLLDGGAPFYGVYETADGRFVAVGALEPAFRAELLRRLGIEGEDPPDPLDRSGWPALRRRLEEIFRTRTRDEWCALLEGSDACVAPVLSMREAPEHPHNRARGTFVAPDGVLQPAPAPRFSRTPAALRAAPARKPAEEAGALADWGFGPDEIAALRAAGALV